MLQNSTAPLWLDLKKEYIDDNFDRLVGYFRNSRVNHDSFYDTTVWLLEKRVDSLIKQLAERPLYQEDNKEDLRFYARLLTTYLLVTETTKYDVPAFMALTYILQLLVPKSSDKLMKLSTNRLLHTKLDHLGVSWDNVIDFQDEVFVQKFVDNCKISLAPLPEMTYSGKSCVYTKGNDLFLTDETVAGHSKLVIGGTTSLDTSVGVALRTMVSSKFKQSDESDLALLRDYVTDFVAKINKIGGCNTPKKAYKDGDTDVLVRVTKKQSKVINVESVDRNHLVFNGRLVFQQPNVLYYTVADICNQIKVGDYLTVDIINMERNECSLEECFKSFLVEWCREDNPVGETCVAQLYQLNPNSMAWISDRGYPLTTSIVEGYELDDLAELEIVRYCDGSQYGKIMSRVKAEIDANTYGGDTFFREKELYFIMNDCVCDYIKSCRPEEEELNGQTAELTRDILGLIVRQLYRYQQSLYKPSEKFRCLVNAIILSEIIDDASAASYIHFTTSYLQALICFVNTQDMDKVQLEVNEEYEQVSEAQFRLSIVEMLKEYGKRADSDVLIKYFSSNDTAISSMARLIQTANTVQDVVSHSTMNVIKREIIRNLKLEREGETDFESEGLKYLGVENDTVEFKTSIVFPPENGMKADPGVQEINVFKGVCAFLNSTVGGTLYLGVRDDGYVQGIDNDKRWLKKETDDQFTRHIMDRAKYYFDTDALVYIRPKMMYDGRVVAIRVAPHPYRVVELQGEAYVRTFNETRVMTDKLKEEQTINKRKKRNEGLEAVKSALWQAQSQKKRAILHQYSSAHSTNDRTIDVMAVLEDHNMVEGCELQPNGEVLTKVFKVDRIGWVEVLDEGLQYESYYKSNLLDAFHMAKGKNPAIHVHLTLDLLAKNLLVEEYKLTEKNIHANAKDPNEWYYDGEVYDIKSIARFYLGLAEHITVNDSPELTAYVADYVKKNLI